MFLECFVLLKKPKQIERNTENLNFLLTECLTPTVCQREYNKKANMDCSLKTMPNIQKILKTYLLTYI